MKRNRKSQSFFDDGRLLKFNSANLYTPHKIVTPRQDIAINTARFGVIVTLPNRWKLNWQKERKTRFWLQFEDKKNIAYFAWNSREQESGYVNVSDYIAKKWVDSELQRYTEGYDYQVTDSTTTKETNSQGHSFVAINYVVEVDVEDDAGHNVMFLYLDVPGIIWHWGMISNHGLLNEPLESSLKVILAHIHIGL